MGPRKQSLFGLKKKVGKSSIGKSHEVKKEHPWKKQHAVIRK